MPPFRVAIAQINPTVGDLTGNTRKIVNAIHQAQERKANIIAIPELAVTGYPPEDLVYKSHFIKENLDCTQQIARETQGITAIYGFIDADQTIFNAAAVASEGKIIGVYHKQRLPNYGVFDEARYFTPGIGSDIYLVDGVNIGVSICEDIWYPEPIAEQTSQGAQLIVNINGSPYSVHKHEIRRNLLTTRALENTVSICYANLVGGQDELVFDGRSMVIDNQGNIIVEAPSFKEDLIIVDLPPQIRRNSLRPPSSAKAIQHEPSQNIRDPHIPSRLLENNIPSHLLENDYDLELLYMALVTGTRDYVHKTGFSKITLGLSGGIDSALVACIAKDALGSDNVTAIAMPSMHSSPDSNEDAQLLSSNLNINFLSIPITNLYESFMSILTDKFEGRPIDTTEENLQARIRSNLLMAFSNKFNWMVLATGNKSELATGYTTLYGDLSGGFAVIKDVPKTLVYKLSKWRNQQNTSINEIPERIISKAPTAELRPNQIDQDSLPPYHILDLILAYYVEQDVSIALLVNMGFDKETVEFVARLVDRNEYKRRQGPLGVKITDRAFGKDRRLPLVNNYTEPRLPNILEDTPQSIS
jgi:NAD+ synthase (glutamine-hydrolysing)